VDVRDAAAAFAAALVDAPLRSSYVFTADVREEVDGPEGIAALLAGGLRADFGVSGEASGLDVALGHRGKVQLDVTVVGRSSHAASPGDGKNAVFGAVPFLAALEREAEWLPSDPLLGPGTLTVTGISSTPAGEVAVVPSGCTIRIDRRFGRDETPDSCRGAIDELVARVAAEHDAPVVVMHNRDAADPAIDIVADIAAFFSRSLEIARRARIAREKIVLDPGIGFGKTPEQSMTALARLAELRAFGLPILVGASRKRFLGRVLTGDGDRVPTPAERDTATLATSVLAAQAGAWAVRVHAVAATVDAVRVVAAVRAVGG
jgi:hypothetical protein